MKSTPGLLFDVPDRCVRSTYCEYPFTRMMSRLFSDLSYKPLPRELSGYSRWLENYIKLVYGFDDEPQVVSPQELPTIEFHLSTETNPIVVGFSGGKDSVATAIRCKREGRSPHLFHVRGINTSYPNEYDCVQDAAEMLGFPLTVAEVKVIGGSDYKENPTKDQLILAMMVDFGVLHGIRDFTLGVEITNRLKTSNIDYNWSDAMEMFTGIGPWFATSIPGYAFHWFIKNHTDSLKTILSESIDLLESTISCLLPYRYQASRKRQNEEKYGVKLLKNRCGSCWKCCVEYLNLIAFDVVGKPNVEFARHCYGTFVLKREIAYGPLFLHNASVAETVDVIVDPRVVDNTRVKEIVCG